MAGTNSGVYPRLDPAACNALTQGPAGLLVPDVELQAQPGVTVTAPAAGACPQAWQIGVDASWAQNATLTFSHAMNGADRTWERVTEVPTLTIPRAGTWEVDYNARAAVGVAAGGVGGMYVVVGIYKNGALIVGTEAMAAGITGAGNGAQATGGVAFLHPFAAGDTVELWAYRIGTGAASVVSNPDGRTRIAAHWLAPTGDTPS